MRGTVCKHLDDLVTAEEVLTPNELKLEDKPFSINRRKKAFWNTLNWIEKTKRTKLIKKEN